MVSILLSIKPEFAYKIISGEKRFEFRRRLCRKEVGKIYIYATSPVKRVLAEVEVKGKIVGDKESVWNNTHGFSGIEKEYYESYFAGILSAGAYSLGRVTVYGNGKELHEFGVLCAPQSFVYIVD